MNKKVLILSEAIGSGHTIVAEALKQGIAHLDPEIKTEVLEVGRFLHPTASNLLVRSYLKINTLSPKLWGKIYEYKHHLPIAKWKKHFIHYLLHRKMKYLLKQKKPDLIVCTHPFTSSSISRLKRKGYPLTLCTVITDFHVHGAWVHSGVDIYFVSSKDMHRQLMNMGVPKNRIAITGIPLRTNFWTEKNKQVLQKKMRLKNIPTVMMMGGGLGIGGIQDLAHELLRWKETVQLIICTGNNTELKRMLFSNRHFHHPHIHILGFVDHIGEWMEVADLLITKAGGVTCFEAITKGTPLYIYQPIPGQEERNCAFLENNQLAIKVDNSLKLHDTIKGLITEADNESSLKNKHHITPLHIQPLAGAEFIVKQLLSS